MKTSSPLGLPEQCEWNPTLNAAASSDDAPHGDAVWCVGAQGQWHLCDSCAQLPRFARFKKTRLHEPRVPEERSDDGERVGDV